eukprot:TRINITY_DN27118_c0_g1_i1.p1 TRINITY_DN27118_c0_g1~~TRINITY_DN27118_c0_g1_i1.p1  ORF type:complete len:235 (-),score=34.89 TRINITY_DN27118_c0_g1_i1:153-857(-)
MYSPFRRRECAFRMLVATVIVYTCVETDISTTKLFVGAPQQKQNVQSLLRQHVFDPEPSQTGSLESTGSDSNTALLLEKRGRVDDLDIAQEVIGTVTRLKSSGAVLDLGLDKSGYIHIGDFREGHVDHISEVAAVGDRVKARVVRVGPREALLSVRDLPEFAKRPVSEFTEGDEIDAEVVRIGKAGKQTIIHFDIGAVTHAFALGRGETKLEKGTKLKVKVNEVKRHSISVAPA